MKIEVDIDDLTMEGVVVRGLKDHRAALKMSVVGYSTPIHSFDPAEEKKQLEKDLKALKRVIRMYK